MLKQAQKKASSGAKSAKKQDNPQTNAKPSGKSEASKKTKKDNSKNESSSTKTNGNDANNSKGKLDKKSGTAASTVKAPERPCVHSCKINMEEALTAQQNKKFEEGEIHNGLFTCLFTIYIMLIKQWVDMKHK